MILLSFVLVVLLLYGGAVDWPMLSHSGVYLIVGAGLGWHVSREWLDRYWRYRNHFYYGCLHGLPNSRRKAKWIDSIGNYLAMAGLLAAGSLEPLLHVALAGWMSVDILIHFAMKLNKGGMAGVMSIAAKTFSPREHSPGFISSCLFLLPAAAMLLALNRPSMESWTEFVCAFLLGAIPLTLNYLWESNVARRWHLKTWVAYQKAPSHMLSDFGLKEERGFRREQTHAALYYSTATNRVRPDA